MSPSTSPNFIQKTLRLWFGCSEQDIEKKYQGASKIKQLGVNSDRALRFGINSAEGFEGPSLTSDRHYLFLGIPGQNSTSETQSKSGFLSNNQNISITNCSGEGNSYFAFYSDLQDEDLPPYRQPSSSYSQWNKTIWGTRVQNSKYLPYENYGFQVEINFGGCQSDFSNSWGKFEAAALGLRFTSKNYRHTFHLCHGHNKPSSCCHHH